MIECNDSFDVEMINYGLEQHLQKLCQNNVKYQLLYSSWMLEKEQYSNRLKTIDQNFYAYSSHDSSHSEVIIYRIESILGEERIHCLTPTDTWLILQCAYTHDLGMVVSADEVEKMMKEKYQNLPLNASEAKKLLEGEEFKNSLEQMILSEGDLGNAAHFTKRYLMREKIDDLLENIYSQNKGLNIEEFSRANYFYYLIISNYFRRRHAQRSCEIVKAEARINTYNDIFPIRLRNIIAEIDKCHGGSWDELMSLPKKDNGFGSDYIHPRFVALLLRLGDLLDMDSNRFNPYLLEVIGEMPEDSKPHLLKHRAISRFCVEPDTIRIVAKFENGNYKTCGKKFSEKYNERDKFDIENDNKQDIYVEKAMKETRSWFKYLKDDLEAAAVHWYELVPKGFPGNIAQLKQADIYLNDRLIDDLDLELTYRISPYRAAEMMEGVGLYKRGMVFIRELVQNALDASKIQFFKNIEEGLYGERSANDLRKNGLVKSIMEFSNQLKGFTVKVFIRLKYSYDGIPYGINVEVVDRGTGISRTDIHKMKNIGSINDSELERLKKEMSEWLKPTGAFGIGMQSIFMLSDRFTIKTRARNELNSNYQQTNQAKPLARKITFYCTDLGGAIINKEYDEREELNKIPYGTSVSVDIELNKKNIMRLFSGEIDDSIFSFDTLTADSSEYIKNKFIQYFTNTFSPELIPIELYVLDENKNIDVKHFQSMIDYISQPFIMGKDHLFISSDLKQQEDYTWWDSANSVWLKIKHKNTDSKVLEKISLYYKGVCVYDNNVLENLRIPYFDTEIHILDMESNSFLNINRDTILPNAFDKIRYKVIESMMRFINCLCNKITEDTNSLQSTYLEKIKGSKALALFLLFQHNFNNVFDSCSDISILAKKETASKLIKLCCEACLTFARINDDVVEIIKNDIIQIEELSNVMEKVWFISSLDFFIDEINHLNISIDKSSDIIPKAVFEDNASRFFGYSYDRVMFIKPVHWSELVQIYTIFPDKGLPARMTIRDFRLIMAQIIKKYIKCEEYISKSHRPVFPASYRFKQIAVKSLPFGTKTEDIERYGAWINSPFTVYELQEISKVINKDEKIETIINKTKSSREYEFLIKYVSENLCFKKNEINLIDEIKLTYDKFIDELVDIMR